MVRWGSYKCLMCTMKLLSLWQHPSFSGLVSPVSLYLCLLPAEVLLSRPGINTGTLSALCVLTVTSTSSRRATSSWRGSCTVRPTREPVRDPQKAMTLSLCTPKLKSFTDENTHASTHAHLHWPVIWMALAEGAPTVTSQTEAKAFRHVSYCVVRERNGKAKAPPSDKNEYYLWFAILYLWGQQWF